MPRSTASRCDLGLALLAIAAGCAHRTPGTPAHAAPDEVHEAPAPHLRQTEISDGEARHEHHDPVPDPARTERVSLGGILAYADKHAPTVTVARSTRARAQAARAAAAPLLPDNPRLTVAAGPRMASNSTGLDLDVGLDQSFEIAGERGLRQHAAERVRELTSAEIEHVRWLVHCDVHAGFHHALVAAEQARLAERVVAFQQDILRVVERQIAAGEVAPLTLRLAQAEVAQATQVLGAARQSYLAARIRLAQLSGWPVATPPTPGGVVDKPRDPPDAETLFRAAREHLGSLRVHAARIREAEARAELAAREAWPKPALGVQYRHEGETRAEAAADIVMGVVALPIPSFQLNQGERARALADASVAAAELDAALRLLAGELAEARSEVVAAAERARAYASDILPRFEENLTLLSRSFELGEIDILALSTGRERFLKIQSDALAAQLDYFVAIAGLERVVGVDLWHDDHHEEDAR